METEFHYLTKTAIELHNDEKFILKRIEQQAEYIKALHYKWRLHKINTDRYIELWNSASAIEEELYDRLDVIYGTTTSTRTRFRKLHHRLEDVKHTLIAEVKKNLVG